MRRSGTHLVGASRENNVARVPPPPSAKPGNWALFLRLLRLCWRYRRRCLLVISLQVVVVLIGLTGLRLAGLGIDYIRNQVEPGSPAVSWPFGLNPPESWDATATLLGIGFGIIAMSFFWGAIRYTAAVTEIYLVQKLVISLRMAVFHKMQQLSFRFFDANASGTIINRVTQDTNAIRNFMSNVVMQSVTLLLSLFIYLCYMLSTHVWLTLACLSPMIVVAILAVRFSRILRPMYDQNRILRDHLVLRLSEHVQGVHVVKGFAREKEQIARFEESSDRVRQQSREIFQHVSTFSPVVGMMTQMSLVILLAYGGYLTIAGKLELGAGMVVFGGLLTQVAAQVQGIAQIANTIQVSMAGAQRVFEIIDTEVEIQSPEEDAVRVERAEGHVEFENVFFAYKTEDPVLRDINFEVKSGEIIAILGATGAGKSTLLSMLPRFYDPQFGRVLLDRTDLRKIDLDDLRHQIGVVFQESFLFSLPVADNIAFGHPDASREQIIQAAKIAAAHEFIMELPNGYDTQIGERGTDLSGGQRQRLAIARAILLDPPILILDDATAAIDPETEHEIMQAMASAMEGRTTFVVAHRLSTMRRADKIIVLDRGRIVQAGKHEELMNQSGPYKWAAQLQEADAESKRLLGVAD